MTATDLRGVICPTVTPINADEGLDTPVLTAHLARVLPHVDAVMALGTTGELAVLRDAVARAALDCVVEYVDRRVPVLVGVGDTGTVRAIEHARHAAEAGADLVSACGPYYYAPLDDEALVGHYRRIADDSRLPVVIYNIPRNTVNALSVDAVARLSAHENIVGIKDSTGDVDRFRRLLELRGDDFHVLQGATERLASVTWQLAADGYVSGLENVAPGSMGRIRNAVEQGNVERVTQEQGRVDALCEITEHGFWLSALKYATSLLAGGTGLACAPLPRLGREDRLAIERIVADPLSEISN